MGAFERMEKAQQRFHFDSFSVTFSLGGKRFTDGEVSLWSKNQKSQRVRCKLLFFCLILLKILAVSVGNEGVTYDEPVVERVSARIHESGCEPYLVRFIRPQKRNQSLVVLVTGTPGNGPPKCPKTKEVYVNMLQPLNYILLYASVTTILGCFQSRWYSIIRVAMAAC